MSPRLLTPLRHAQRGRDAAIRAFSARESSRPAGVRPSAQGRRIYLPLSGSLQARRAPSTDSIQARPAPRHPRRQMRFGPRPRPFMLTRAFRQLRVESGK